MTPFFSVIIPTYNREKVLRRAIDSVLSQKFQDFELIVVDDGSTDDSVSLLTDVAVIRSQNLGVSSARNLGIKKAVGQWICFLDSDDEWLPNKLLEQKKAIDQGSFKIVHSDEIWIRKGVRVNPMKKHQKAGGDLFYRSLELCLISAGTVCVEADLMKANLFDPSYPCCEDYDLWLRLLCQHEIGYIDKKLIKKYGGADDQLSVKFPHMNLYRVRSIYKNFSLFTLEQQKIAARVGKDKCEVLLKVFKKYSDSSYVAEVSTILRELDAFLKDDNNF